MRQIVIRIVVAGVLIGAGWSVGRAQTTVADFEISIEAPEGTVYLKCHRGCDWPLVAEQYRNPKWTAENSTNFGCRNSPSGRCGYTFNGKGHLRR